MPDEALIKSLDKYISRVFIVGDERQEVFYKRSCVDHGELAELLEDKQPSLAEYIQTWLLKKGRDEVEVYKEALLDRRVFSKIRNDKTYHPSKNTTIAIALAMHLSKDEAVEFLDFVGYSLNRMQKEDVIIRYCFEHEIHDVMVVNELLDHYGLSCL